MLDNEKEVITNDECEIEGTVEAVIFQNEDNGYSVLSVDIGGNEITAVGNMPFFAKGDLVRLRGSYVNHPTFGRQFKVSSFEKKLPGDKNAILRYLSSRAIKGVGPSLAEKMVDMFGEDLFEIIERRPELLCDIKGISPKKAQAISESFRLQFGIRNVLMFFSGYFGGALITKIYKRWGGGAVDVVKNNPYILSDEIEGIGFEKADAMASAIGIAKNAPERIAAGIKYSIKHEEAASGNTFLYRDRLVKISAELLKVDDEAVERGIDTLLERRILVSSDFHGKEAIYHISAYVSERYCASKLVELNSVNFVGAVDNADALIDATEAEEKLSYAPGQREAIKNAVTGAVSILTGGPGTGKTTVIKAIIRVFRNMGMRVFLAAPTGRAAMRMSEATGEEAKTVHRLLEIEFSQEGEMKFFRCENNPLETDVVIIDEFSMVDIYLFASLLRALKTGTRLVLIGDASQLPSVGAGDVLRSIIESKAFMVTSLTEIFRQAKESMIIVNAHRINDGLMPLRDNKKDFFFLPAGSNHAACETLIDLCARRLPKSYGRDVNRGVQVITASKKGECGTYNLNIRLQAVLNPPSAGKAEKKVRDLVFREGDKVMQIQNNYDIDWTRENGDYGRGIFNGDIGRITKIDYPNEYYEINFDGRIAEYDFSDSDQLEHAFAVTVHKSQGSEYPIVIIPITEGTRLLETRNLLYTAVTRGSKMVILVGSGEVLARMVKNNETRRRLSGLPEMIAKEAEARQKFIR